MGKHDCGEGEPLRCSAVRTVAHHLSDGVAGSVKCVLLLHRTDRSEVGQVLERWIFHDYIIAMFSFAVNGNERISTHDFVQRM